MDVKAVMARILQPLTDEERTMTLPLVDSPAAGRCPYAVIPHPDGGTIRVVELVSDRPDGLPDKYCLVAELSMPHLYGTPENKQAMEASGETDPLLLRFLRLVADIVDRRDDLDKRPGARLRDYLNSPSVGLPTPTSVKPSVN